MLLGDRGYARPLALRAVLDAGAEFIARLGWAQLRRREADDTALAWAPIFDALAPGEVARTLLDLPPWTDAEALTRHVTMARHADAA